MLPERRRGSYQKSEGLFMSPDSLQTLIAMICYMAVVIFIGLYFAKRANKSSENYFIGGRSLGPWVAAMSAEASDMSGWLLMGLPGVAYWCGISDAFWTALGLAVGTYLNWLLVAKRLRRYSHVAGDAITVPDFFSNRFREKKKVLMTISAVFILIFFTVYASSCFVTCGKLFSTLFGAPYQLMMVLGALFVILYTFLGGFLAESVSDFMQAVVMIFALVTILVTGTLRREVWTLYWRMLVLSTAFWISLASRLLRWMRRRTTGGKWGPCVRRGRAIWTAYRDFNPFLGAWLFWRASGSASVYGHSKRRGTDKIPSHRY